MEELREKQIKAKQRIRAREKRKQRKAEEQTRGGGARM